MPRVPKIQQPPPTGYVWIDDAARRLGIAKSTLYKWRQQNYGPTGVSIARRLAYRTADIDAHLEALYEAATEPKAESRPPEPAMTTQHRGRTRRKPARAAA